MTEHFDTASPVSAAPKRPLKVFLCHADVDNKAVRALYDRLVKDGVDAWLDKENILPGQAWDYEIRKAVREADVVVVCLSKQFNQAGFRQKEMRWALDTAMEQPEGEIYIIPARLEECESPDDLKRWHWVDIFADNGYQKLTGALSLRAERVNATFEKKLNLKYDLVTSITNAVDEQVILFALGSDHHKKGDLTGAIGYYEKALELSEKLGDRKTQATILSNLSSVYEHFGDLVVASGYLQHALDVAAEIDSGFE